VPFSVSRIADVSSLQRAGQTKLFHPLFVVPFTGGIVFSVLDEQGLER
jgi:hypothetical protein